MLKEKYGFSFDRWKIIFAEKYREYNKKFKISVLKYIFFIKFKHLLSIPFIYMVFIPVVILDIVLFIFQQTCFRLYGIPLIKRSDYIVYDRAYLDYLNIIQKMNCLYCAYVNGIFSYAVEIWWRTEKYWCPIKHAKKTKWPNHNWQEYFADYWDPEGFKECVRKKTEFFDK